MGESAHTMRAGSQRSPKTAAAAKRALRKRTLMLWQARPHQQRRVLRSSTRAANDVGEPPRVDQLFLTIFNVLSSSL